MYTELHPAMWHLPVWWEIGEIGEMVNGGKYPHQQRRQLSRERQFKGGRERVRGEGYMEERGIRKGGRGSERYSEGRERWI